MQPISYQVFTLQYLPFFFFTQTDDRPHNNYIIDTLKYLWFDEQGLVFYTDRGSRKVVDLEENKYVSVLFYWTLPTTARQVRVTGKVEQLQRDEVVALFLNHAI